MKFKNSFSFKILRSSLLSVRLLLEPLLVQSPPGRVVSCPVPLFFHSRRVRWSDSLSEKDRRRYAALEAAKLGHGGADYIATVLGCDPKTIRHGQHELADLPLETRELAFVICRRTPPTLTPGGTHRQNQGAATGGQGADPRTLTTALA